LTLDGLGLCVLLDLLKGFFRFSRLLPFQREIEGRDGRIQFVLAICSFIGVMGNLDKVGGSCLRGFGVLSEGRDRLLRRPADFRFQERTCAICSLGSFLLDLIEGRVVVVVLSLDFGEEVERVLVVKLGLGFKGLVHV
jgi:hypothetical protein